MVAENIVNTLVSIIIPVYNTEAYLRACLDSILCQTYKNYEVILVDDGSSDNSGILCDHLADEYTEVVVVHQENLGASAARNVGLKMAKGSWVMFVDSDDELYDKYSLENLMERTMNVDLVVGGLSKIDEAGAGITKYPKSVKRIFSAHDFSLLLLNSTYGYLGFAWAKLYKASFLKNIQFDEKLFYCEDQHFVVQYLCASKDIKVCLDNTICIYKYFVRVGSLMNLTQRVYNHKFFSDFLAYEKIEILLHHTFMDHMIDKLAIQNLIGSGCRILSLTENTSDPLYLQQRKYILAKLKALDTTQQIHKQICHSSINNALRVIREELVDANQKEKVETISKWIVSKKCQFRYLNLKWKLVYILHALLGKSGLMLIADKL